MISNVVIRHLNQRNVEAEHIMITELSDLPKYFDNVSDLCVQHFTKVLKSNLPADKWENYSSTDQGISIFKQAVIEASSKGNNPIFNIDSAIHRKFLNFTNILVEYGSVLVNKVGGFCPYMPECHEIVSQHPHSFNKNKFDNVVLNDNTKYINLENDPMLEEHTINYLSSIDPHFSSIVNLRKFSVDELTTIFKEFKAKGGETVYVYTTGSDVPQMQDYSQAIINAGLKRVEFEFNAGFNDELNKVIDKLKSNGIEIEIERKHK